MSMSLEELLPDGILLRLERADAKTFFATRGETALVSLIWQLAARARNRDDNSLLALEGTAESLETVLQADLPDALAVLGLCFTGGRPQLDTPRHRVCMVRPDLVAKMASALQEWLRFPAAGVFSDAETSKPLRQRLVEVQAFYEAATAQKAAIVYARLESPVAPD